MLYRVNNADWHGPQFYSNQINPNQSSVFRFIQTFDFSKPGFYTLEVVSQVFGDRDITDNRQTLEIRQLANNPINLPYFQSFEACPSNVYQTKSIFGLSGANEVDFDGSSNSAIFRTAFFPNSGRRAANLLCDRSVSVTTVNLTVTLNLGDYSGAPLALTAAVRGDLPSTVIYVRGSDSSDWIMLKSWNSNEGTTRYVALSNDLTFLSTQYNQSLSTSTQLRFSLACPANVPASYEGFSVDDINLYVNIPTTTSIPTTSVTTSPTSPSSAAPTPTRSPSPTTKSSPTPTTAPTRKSATPEPNQSYSIQGNGATVILVLTISALVLAITVVVGFMIWRITKWMKKKKEEEHGGSFSQIPLSALNEDE